MAPARLIACGLAAALLASVAGGCGRKGPPLPPGLRLPAAPGKVILAGPDGALTLSWAPPREDLGGRPVTAISGYAVLRGAWPPGEGPCASCPDDLKPAGTVDAVERRGRGLPETAWVEEDAQPGWTYRYRVRALDARGRPGAPSAPVQIRWIPLPAPAVTAAPGDREARLRVAAPSWPEGVEPLGIRVYGAEDALLAAVEPGEGVAVVSPLANGVAHALSVRLAARTPEGWDVESPGTRVVVTPEDTTPPLPPADLVALAEAGVGIQLRWLPGGGEAYDRVVVLRAAEGEELRELVRLPGTDVAYLDAAVTPGRTYRYAIVAVDARGNRSLPTREARVRAR